MADSVLENIAALKDEDWEVREDAASILGREKDSRAVLPLVDLLADEDRSVRMAAMDALLAIGKSAVVPLGACLSWKDTNIQELASSILSHIADSRVLDPLINALGNTNWIVRMHAAKALGRVKDPKAAEPLCPLLHDKVKGVREECVQALTQLGDAGVPFLLEGLKHEEWIVRLHAIEALGNMKSSQGVEALLYVLFNDRDSAVRVDAARALGNIGNPQAVEHLITAMRQKDLRPVAIEALGKIADTRAVQAIVEVVTGSDKPAEGRIITGCGDRYEEEMIAVEAAVKALGLIKDVSVLPTLVKALQNTMVREEAANALVAFGQPAIPYLLDVFKKDPDDNVRFHAGEALKSLGWRQKRLKPIPTPTQQHRREYSA